MAQSLNGPTEFVIHQWKTADAAGADSVSGENGNISEMENGYR